MKEIAQLFSDMVAETDLRNCNDIDKLKDLARLAKTYESSFNRELKKLEKEQSKINSRLEEMTVIQMGNAQPHAVLASIEQRIGKLVLEGNDE